MELLVASAILVVLGVAGYVALDVVLGTAERTSQQSEGLKRLQRCFISRNRGFQRPDILFMFTECLHCGSQIVLHDHPRKTVLVLILGTHA